MYFRHKSLVISHKSCNGYIALTSAIIISALIMTVVLAVSLKGYSNRLNISETYDKETSLFLAEACVNKAMLNLSLDPLYAGSETITLGADTCDILPLEDLVEVPPKKVIKATATFNEATTNLKVTVLTLLLDIVLWEEVDML